MKRFRIDYMVFTMIIQPLMKEHFLNLDRWHILKIKRAFEDYLIAFDNERLLDIPESGIKVLLNMKHPLKTHGFNPETILHFIEFSKTYQIEE